MPKESGGWLHPRVLLRYVLTQDDTPHHIALGAAIGMFVGLTPTPGVQMLLVLAIYYVCRPAFTFNRPAGLAAVYASNPLTAVPLAWISYQVGRLFVGGDLTREEIAAVLQHDQAGWWDAVVALVVDLGWAYLIGALIVATVTGILTYPIMRYLLHLFRSSNTGDSGSGSNNVGDSDGASPDKPATTKPHATSHSPKATHSSKATTIGAGESR